MTSRVPATEAGRYPKAAALRQDIEIMFRAVVNTVLTPDEAKSVLEEVYHGAVALEVRIATLETALTDMTRQFAYWSDKVGGYQSGGLSALEGAFDALGWKDPHPAPEATCDEPGCLERATCGTPTTKGYRWLCGSHFAVLSKETS